MPKENDPAREARLARIREIKKLPPARVVAKGNPSKKIVSRPKLTKHNEPYYRWVIEEMFTNPG